MNIKNIVIKENMPIIGVMFLATFLRFIYLGSKSLWLDEASNLIMAERDIYTWTFGEPPLYYLILHFILKIGNSEFIVRFPSMIFGILSVFMIYKVGNLFSKREAIISSLLLSVSMTSIVTSQETKYYSLFIFLSLSTIYYFLKMEYENKQRDKILFLGSLILSLYSHYFTIILLVSIVVYKIITLKIENLRKNLRSFFVIIGIFILFAIPIFSKMVSQFYLRSDTTSSLNFVYQTHLSTTFLSDIFGFMLLNEFSDGSLVGVLYVFIILIFMIIGIVLSLKDKRRFLMIWLFVPIILAGFLTFFITNLFIRYIIFILPAIYLLASNGIIKTGDILKNKSDNSNFNSNKLIYSVVLIILITNFWLLNIYYMSKDNDWRDTADYIKSITNGRDDDNIVLIPGYNDNPFGYYYKGKTIQYTNFDDFTKIVGNGKETYIIFTKDIYALKRDELEKLVIMADNSKLIAQFPGDILIRKMDTGKMDQIRN